VSAPEAPAKGEGEDFASTFLGALMATSEGSLPAAAGRRNASMRQGMIFTADGTMAAHEPLESSPAGPFSAMAGGPGARLEQPEATPASAEATETEPIAPSPDVAGSLMVAVDPRAATGTMPPRQADASAADEDGRAVDAARSADPARPSEGAGRTDDLLSVAGERPDREAQPDGDVKAYREPRPDMVAPLAGQSQSQAVRETPRVQGARVSTPDAIDRSLDHLDPAFRAKIERVTERMQAEYGRRVELIEGYRDPGRQAQLFEQGRSEPGPVVTWTRDSLHTVGRAADFRVDGSFEDPVAYAQLQQVAREEGLRTLGPRDQGHLELPMSAESKARTATAEPRPGASTSVGVAGEARVASVAKVASVARVARPARPGNSGSATRTLPQAQPTGIPEAPAPIEATVPRDVLLPTAVAASGAPRSGGTDPERSGKSANEGGADARVAALDSLPPAANRPADSAQPVDRLAGLDALGRVERVLQAREAVASAPASRVSIRLDGSQGPVEQIRVGLLRNRVDAEVDLTDPVTARLVRSRVSELRQAMERRGLEMGTMGVRATGTDGSAESWFGARAAAAPGADILRSILEGAGTAARDGSRRDPAPRHQQTSYDGAGSDRSRRDNGKERNR
jgi:hypothetical protein